MGCVPVHPDGLVAVEACGRWYKNGPASVWFLGSPEPRSLAGCCPYEIAPHRGGRDAGYQGVQPRKFI